MRISPRLTAFFLMLFAGALVADWSWDQEGGWASFTPGTFPEPSSRELLLQCKKAMGRQKYQDALRGLEAYFKQYGEVWSDGEPGYLLGECLYQQRRYVEAHEALQKVMSRHPGFRDIRLVIEREYDIAAALLNGAQTVGFLGWGTTSEDLGRQILEELAGNYQFEAFSDDALYLIASFDFRNGDYADALVAYERLLRIHPDSEWAGVSLYQQALCHLKLSDRPEYDQTHMMTALGMLRRYVAEYRGDLIRKAKKTLVELEETLAAQELKVANYYIWEDQPISGAVYLRSILRNYPDSKTAAEAGRILKKLESSGALEQTGE